MINQEEKAYSEILKLMRKHKDILCFDLQSLEIKASFHLFGLELKNEYGLNIDPKEINSLDWNRFGEFKSIGRYGEKYRRTISWSVDGSQPEDEVLFTFSFPTGAYIFGDGGLFDKDYPTVFFQKFWLELKTYKPDYIDEMNHALYWKLENAKEMFNSFDDILKKYYALNREDIKQRRIAKMEADLIKLKNN